MVEIEAAAPERMIEQTPADLDSQSAKVELGHMTLRVAS
jgi:hypothetical protein